MLNRWIEPELLGVLREDGHRLHRLLALAAGLLTDRYLKGCASGLARQPPGSMVGGNADRRDMADRA